MIAPFTRILHGGERGIDIEGIGRALCRAGLMFPLADSALAVFNALPLGVRRTYGWRKQQAVNKLRKGERWAQNGVYNERVHAVLLDGGYFDARATELMRVWVPPPQIPPLVSPVQVGRVPTFLHPTAGLVGNWALDWMNPGGTPVVAVEEAKIKKLSGRDPSQGADQYIGIYGWSIHYESAQGYRYFSTHYGRRENLALGQVVRAGQKLGEIGNWPGDPGRSHLHLGVTSPLGVTDAQARIKQVAASPRVGR